MRALWLTGGLGLLLFVGLSIFLAPLEPSVLRLQFAFTPRAFGQIVHTWQVEGLARYRAHFPADFALLLSYAVFGYLLARRTRLAAMGGVWARWLLPAAALADALENVLHLWLTAAPRLAVFWPYPLAASAASCKWLLVLAFGLWIVAARLRQTSP
ncbi:MAG: hypothetical protein HYZ17_08985 [Betaproteobacteria bacterium]|nr:hypothetical protein [Betaproteobacteria bacterium]